MSLIRKLAGETAIYGISNVLNRLLNYIIVTPYLTRVFDQQEDYGIHGIMYAFAAFLMVLLTYGMETAFFRFASNQKNQDKPFATASLSLLFSTIILVALIALFAGDLAAQLTTRSDAIFVQLFAFIIGFDVLVAIPFAKLRLDNRPIRFAFFKAINIVVNGLLIIFFLEICPWLMRQGNAWAEQFYNPSYKLHYVFIANLVASFITFLLLLPEYFRIRLRFDYTLWQQMLRYAAPLVIVGIAGMINQLADRYLLVQLLPGNLEENLKQVGIYNACVKIAVLMSLFTQAFKFAAEPFFFRHAAREDARQVYAQVGQAFAIVGSLAFLVVMLFLDLFQHLIAENYRSGLGVVPILLLAYLFLGLYYNFSVWYKLTDKTHIGAFISIGGAIITLSLNILLIPQIGFMASAWAALACFLFMTILSYVVGQKYYPVPYSLGKMVFIILLALGIYAMAEIALPVGNKLAWLANLGWVSVFLFAVYRIDRPFFKSLMP